MLMYSATTNAFYDTTICKEVPDGAVEISAARHQELLNEQSKGKAIFPDAHGNPINLPVKPAYATTWNNAAQKWELDAQGKAEAVAAAIDKIDADTDAAILTGFECQGMKFKLSLENQVNYKTECELRDNLTYPHRVKSLTGYYDIASAADYLAFYLAGVQYIRSCIEAGWAKKDQVAAMTNDELLAYLNS